MTNKKPLCFLTIVMTLLATFSCTTAKIQPDYFLDRETISGASIFYIHGAGDDSTTWAKSLLLDETSIAIDWKEEASNRLTAPARGYQLGLSMARSISPGEHTVYAHSAGAWVAQGIADGMARLGRTDALTIIFLDPFTALSVVQPFAGARMLGRNATSVETWYTTHDPIPFTAGRVMRGSRLNVDSQIPAEYRGTEAHWQVIDLYMRGNPHR